MILFLEGVDPYDRPLGISQLPYAYPPFPLVAFLPLALINPGLPLAAVVNTVLQGVAIWAVLRSHSQTGATGFLQVTAEQAVLGAAILVGVQWLQPVNSNTVSGRVNVVLMAMVVVDMLVSFHGGSAYTPSPMTATAVVLSARLQPTTVDDRMARHQHRSCGRAVNAPAPGGPRSAHRHNGEVPGIAGHGRGQAGPPGAGTARKEVDRRG